MKIEMVNGALTITDFDPIEAFKIACKIEKDGMIFYEKLAAAITDENVKDKIDFLSRAEEKHLKFFDDCLAAERNKRDEKFEDDDLFSCGEYGVFEIYKNMANLEDIVADSGVALRLGVQVEKRSIQFYEICKQQVSDDEVKATLDAIIKEEESHLRKLQALLAI